MSVEIGPVDRQIWRSDHPRNRSCTLTEGLVGYSVSLASRHCTSASMLIACRKLPIPFSPRHAEEVVML